MEKNKSVKKIKKPECIFNLLIGCFVIAGMFITSGLLLIGDGSAETPSTREIIIEYFDINAVIDNNYATTDIEVMCRNPNNASIAQTFSFSIPEEAFISNFSITVDGEKHYAAIVPKDQAKQIYDAAVLNGTDAGLVEAREKNVFSYSVSLSPYQEMVLGLRYEQYLEKS